MYAHYRSPVVVTQSTVAAAAGGVERLDAFARQFSGARQLAPDREAIDRFRERMDDDLDTPGAVRVGFDLVRDARAASGEESGALAAAVFEIFERTLGLPLHDEGRAIPEDVLARARARDTARASKSWAEADELRAGLQAEDGLSRTGLTGPQFAK
jgi:cysteinyl-tRNA synthetase